MCCILGEANVFPSICPIQKVNWQIYQDIEFISTLKMFYTSNNYYRYICYIACIFSRLYYY